MKRVLATLCLAACTSAAAADSVFAQQGRGLGRGLGNAATASATASASRGMGHSAEVASRAAGSPNTAAPGFNRAASSLNRGAPGLQRSAVARGSALPPMTGAGFHSQARTNHDRITQQRLQQADHLRALSQRNGNEALQATADRMEANALENQQRWQTQFESGGPVPGEAALAAPHAPAVTAPALPAPAAKARGNAKRGFWFRSR